MLTTKIFENTMASVKTLKEDSPEGFSQAQVIGIAVREYAASLGYIEVSNGLATLGDTLGFTDETTSSITGINGKDIVLSNHTILNMDSRLIRTSKKLS